MAYRRQPWSVVNGHAADGSGRELSPTLRVARHHGCERGALHACGPCADRRLSPRPDAITGRGRPLERRLHGAGARRHRGLGGADSFLACCVCGLRRHRCRLRFSADDFPPRDGSRHGGENFFHFSPARGGWRELAGLRNFAPVLLAAESVGLGGEELVAHTFAGPIRDGAGTIRPVGDHHPCRRGILRRDHWRLAGGSLVATHRARAHLRQHTWPGAARALDCARGAGSRIHINHRRHGAFWPGLRHV